MKRSRANPLVAIVNRSNNVLTDYQIIRMVPALQRQITEHFQPAWGLTAQIIYAERNVPKDARIAPIVVASGAVAETLRRGEPLLRSLTGAASVTIVAGADRPPNSAVTVLADAEVILPLEGLIDGQAEAARNRKALAEIDRQLGAVRAKLGNESFLARAPAELVAQQRAREAELVAQRQAVAALLTEG